MMEVYGVFTADISSADVDGDCSCCVCMMNINYVDGHDDEVYGVFTSDISSADSRSKHLVTDGHGLLTVVGVKLDGDEKLAGSELCSNVTSCLLYTSPSPRD